MKGFPKMDTSSKHGTNKNFAKSGAPFLGKIGKALKGVVTGGDGKFNWKDAGRLALGPLGMAAGAIKGMGANNPGATADPNAMAAAAATDPNATPVDPNAMPVDPNQAPVDPNATVA